MPRPRKSPSGAVRILRDRAAALRSLQSSPYQYYGFYRGYVTALMTTDHEEYKQGMEGRVKVRVPALHHSAEVTPDASLPWAEVTSMGGGLSDCGSYEPPYKGAKVLVVFEQGHPGYPLVVATWRAAPSKGKKVVVAEDELTSPAGLEMPLEAQESPTTRQVWKKSWKGHAIYCEERTGREFLRIVDRVGNVIELSGPALKADTRRVGNAVDGNALTLADLDPSTEAHILLKDIAGQEIRMKTGMAPEITITTPGLLRLGGVTATFGLALAKLLYAALHPVVTALRYHTHQVYKEGAPSGPPIPTIPMVPADSAFSTVRTLGGLD